MDAELEHDNDYRLFRDVPVGGMFCKRGRYGLRRKISETMSERLSGGRGMDMFGGASGYHDMDMFGGASSYHDSEEIVRYVPTLKDW